MRPGERKLKHEPVDEGAPAWALTFGDLMTQLLTFFILLFSISDVKQQKIYEVFRSFRTYFKIDVPAMGYTIRSLEPTLEALSRKARNLPDQRGVRGQSHVVVDEQIGKFATVEAKDESVKLTIAAETLFEGGSARLSAGAEQNLAVVADKLSGYWTRIKILGHTSPLPLPPGSPFPHHFALGSARAQAVADFLVGRWEARELSGEARRIEVASRGRNDPPKDWTDQAKYDRVEIIVTAEPVLRRNTLKRMSRGQVAGRPREGELTQEGIDG